MDEYAHKYQRDIIELIAPIQQTELNVAVTIEDQPDLQNIPSFYKTDNGNFWVALNDDKVVGTIGLIDFGSGQVAL